jgi:signal transduction histidine kinase
MIVEFADDGVGFDPAAIHDGHGLSNMLARVNGLHGTLGIENTGSGMRLELRIPIDETTP